VKSSSDKRAEMERVGMRIVNSVATAQLGGGSEGYYEIACTILLYSTTILNQQMRLGA
jgi:hypothetical protein